MCGIGGIYVKQNYVDSFPVEDFADIMLLGLEGRGRDATGIVSVDSDGKISLDKKDKQAKHFILERDAQLERTKMALLHTRYETQGSSKNPGNNHPVVWDSCFVVHNGHIYNDKNVFDDLELERRAEVDSEAIVACLAANGLDTAEHIEKTLETLEGNMAIAAIDPIKNPGRLLLAKGESSPLVILNHRKCIIWASELDVIKQAWGIVIGTPPEKSVFWGGNSANKIPDYGYHRLTEGDYWIIEDDKITRGKFTPNRAWGYTNNYRTPHNWETTGGDDDWTKIVHSTRRGSSGEIIATYKKYYCNPTTMACTFACNPGCLTSNCLCFVEEDQFQPACKNCATKYKCDTCFYSPQHCDCRDEVAAEYSLTDIKTVDQEATNGDRCTFCSHLVMFCICGKYTDGVYTSGPDTESSIEFTIKCDSCWEAFPEAEINYSGGEFHSNLCDECDQAADWEGKNVVSLDDKRQQHYQEIAEQEADFSSRACLEVSKLMNTTELYISWLLFTASLEDLENNSRLAKSREIADGHYSAIYNELKAEV